MSDQEKLDKIRNIYETKSFGLPELELVLSISESLEDRSNRDFYICTSAEWLAIHSDLSDLNKAIVLVRSAHMPIEKHSALVAIASRYMRESYRRDALDILSEAEANLTELEKISVIEWQQAQAWEEIADVYMKLGELPLAKRAWTKAVSLAQIGQLDDSDRLNAKECASILFALVKRLIENGDSEEAALVAESIKVDSWRQSALKEVQKGT